MEAQEALEQFFGFREFREPQREVIAEILSGRDVFVVMPTGGGKSLCYQLPALLLDGVTIVVSPLIALMKDQLDGLQERGIAATLINSTITGTEQQHRIQRTAAISCNRCSRYSRYSRYRGYRGGRRVGRDVSHLL